MKIEKIYKEVGGPKKVIKNKVLVGYKVVQEKKETIEPSNWQLQLGQIVRNKREYLHLSQKNLANEVGSNQSNISKFELGHGNTTAGFINKIAKYLNLNLTISDKKDS